MIVLSIEYRGAFKIKTGSDHHLYGKSPRTLVDVTGQVFGNLKVVSHVIGKGFVCNCSCGNQYIAKYSTELTKGRRTSCGKCKRVGPYSNDEDKVILKFAGEKSAAEIGEMIGRNKQSIRERASLIGVSLKRYGNKNPSTKYAEEDVELARCLSDEGLKAKVIAEKMEINEGYLKKILSYSRRQVI